MEKPGSLHAWGTGLWPPMSNRSFCSQVFLKYYHSERLLKVLARHDQLATVLQCLVRGWRARRKAREMRKERNARAATKIQAGTLWSVKGQHNCGPTCVGWVKGRQCWHSFIKIRSSLSFLVYVVQESDAILCGAHISAYLSRETEQLSSSKQVCGMILWYSVVGAFSCNYHYQLVIYAHPPFLKN